MLRVFVVVVGRKPTEIDPKKPSLTDLNAIFHFLCFCLPALPSPPPSTQILVFSAVLLIIVEFSPPAKNGTQLELWKTGTVRELTTSQVDYFSKAAQYSNSGAGSSPVASSLPPSRLGSPPESASRNAFALFCNQCQGEFFHISRAAAASILLCCKLSARPRSIPLTRLFAFCSISHFFTYIIF